MAVTDFRATTARLDGLRTLTEHASVCPPTSSADEASAAELLPVPIRDRELFALIYRSMQKLVPARDHEFDDLVQAAAAEVWRTLDRFEGRSELSTWVYGICYRVLLNHRRFWRRFRQRFEVGVVREAANDDAGSLELVSEHARAERLRTLLGRMSDKYRAVVVLHDLEELSVAEIAAIVGANELTVRSRLRDGRRQLRRLLDHEPLLAFEEVEG